MLTEFGLVQIKSTKVKPGDVFGRLTVCAAGRKPERNRSYAVCYCECGAGPLAVRFDALRRGVTVSCGCYQAEVSTSHGLSKSVHYKRWLNMIDRCDNPECVAYPDYGARGIKVCPEWYDIARFIDDLPSGYRDGLEMDRIDNDGNYEPGNVRWATSAANADNRRTGRKLTYNGKTQSFTRWEKELGLRAGTLKDRIDASGWTVERAISTPSLSLDEVRNMGRAARWAGHVKKPRPKPRVYKKYPYQGELLTMAEISAKCGVPLRLLNKRICERGWTVERATST